MSKVFRYEGLSKRAIILSGKEGAHVQSLKLGKDSDTDGAAFG